MKDIAIKLKDVKETDCTYLRSTKTWIRYGGQREGEGEGKSKTRNLDG